MRVWRPPKVLWRYIGFEILAIFAVALIAQSIINIGIISFQLVQRDGLRLAFIWPLLFKISIYSLYYTIPVSLLFAVTLGFGRMIGDLEVVALRSCGLSNLQLMAPALVLAFGCCGVTYYLNNKVIPEIHYDKRNLRLVLLKQLTNLGSGGECRFPLPRDQGEIYCQRYYGNTMERVRLSLWSRDKHGRTPESDRLASDTDKISTTINAEYAKFNKEVTPEGDPQLVVDLYNLDVHIPDRQLRNRGDPHFLQRISTNHYQKMFPLSESTRREKDKQTHVLEEELAANMLALEKLEEKLQKENRNLQKIKSMENDILILKDDIWDGRTEISRRMAFSLSCFTFLWVAIPLTLWLNHRNRLVPFFLGNLVAVGLYYPLVTLGIMMSKKGFPTLLTHSGNFVLFILGGVIIWRIQKN